MKKKASEKFSYCYLHLSAPRGEAMESHPGNHVEVLDSDHHIVDFELKDDCSKRVIIIQM